MWLSRLARRIRPARPRRPADDGNLEADPEHEGRLELNTAALMDGAPPAGVSGRTQPSGPTPDPRPPHGSGEGEIQNMPG